MARPQGGFSMMEMMVALAVIGITPFAMRSDDQKAKEAAATAYLAKPYSPRDLLALIRKILPDA